MGPGPSLVAKFGPARTAVGKGAPFLAAKIGPGRPDRPESVQEIMLKKQGYSIICESAHMFFDPHHFAFNLIYI